MNYDLDDTVKWYFGCIAVIALVAMVGASVQSMSGAETLRREAVLLGYATDGPEGFKWKEKQ